MTKSKLMKKREASLTWNNGMNYIRGRPTRRNSSARPMVKFTKTKWILRTFCLQHLKSRRTCEYISSHLFSILCMMIHCQYFLAIFCRYPTPNSVLWSWKYIGKVSLSKEEDICKLISVSHFTNFRSFLFASFNFFSYFADN